jgi:hypothetical protein
MELLSSEASMLRMHGFKGELLFLGLDCDLILLTRVQDPGQSLEASRSHERQLWFSVGEEETKAEAFFVWAFASASLP